LLNPEGGTDWTADRLLKEISRNPLTTGVTFSGGEPMAQAEALLPVAKALKERGYNLWIYTGYLWEELDGARLDLAALADVVVDGPYDAARRSLSLLWRGSENQRLIDVRKSLDGGRAVIVY
jgi:anaerobic ribonucleoside-triphosphate reductase activating protein